jgi:hypothetical protein
MKLPSATLRAAGVAWVFDVIGALRQRGVRSGASPGSTIGPGATFFVLAVLVIAWGIPAGALTSVNAIRWMTYLAAGGLMSRACATYAAGAAPQPRWNRR